jgi:hypothetical protein
MENQVNNVEEAKEQIVALDVVEKVEPLTEETKDFSALAQEYGEKLTAAAGFILGVIIKSAGRK